MASRTAQAPRNISTARSARVGTREADRPGDVDKGDEYPRKSARQQPRDQSEFPRIEGAISGTLGGDPELRFTSSDRAVANISVASTERIQDEMGNWADGETTWHRVTVWGQMGEHVAASLVRGDRIVAVGYFQDREWENRDGELQVSTEFTATEIGASLLFRNAEIKRPVRSSR